MKTRCIPKLAGLFCLALVLAFVLSSPGVAHSQESGLDGPPALELLQEADGMSDPGQVRYVGNDQAEPVTITVTKYNKDSLEKVVVAGRPKPRL